MSQTHLFNIIVSTFVASVLIVALGIGSYFAFEPVIGQGAVENFEVTQTISGAISFLASTSPVTMSGTLDGLTGGTSWGTTTSRVRTNNSSGYSMTIKFASTAPMIRNGGGGTIPTFLYSTGTVSYPAGFTTSVSNAQLGFSVNASNTTEVSSVFVGDGTVCGTGTGGTFTVNSCWRGASSTNAAATTQLVSTSAPTPSSGSTSTVQFRITIPNNPSPAVPNGTYTATATLTALEN
jgi:hypothetical protein